MDALPGKTKSFWTSKESIGAWLLVGGAGALTLYGWGIIVPFLVDAVTNTFKLAVIGTGLVVFLLAVFSPRTRMVFRLLSRAVSGLITNIDPIGVIEDRVSQMKKRRTVMKQQTSAVSGQIEYLQDIIAKNAAKAEENMQLAAKAQQRAQSGDLNMALQVRVKANKAGRLEKSNMSYQQLLSRLQLLYEWLTKWGAHMDAYIEDTEDEVTQTKIRTKTVGAAYKAFRSAMSVLVGHGVEEDMYERAMETLAEQTSVKLGEIADFQRDTQSFMDGLDLENGVVTDEALKKLESYKQKLLLPGAPEFLKTALPASAQVVEGEYATLLRKERK